MELEKIIENYCNSTERFTLDDILNHVTDITPAQQRFIEDYLEENLLVFKKQEKNIEYYYSRNIFFKNFTFKIIISDEEKENNILFPGHKFIPFYNSECFPSELKIQLTENDKYLRTKQIKKKLDELYCYHSLLGADNIIDYFLTESNSNKDLTGNPQKSITLSVLDLTVLKEKPGFLNNHELYLKVLDWEKGILQLLPAKEHSFDRERTMLWIETMEEALLQAINDKGAYVDIHEQFSLAFFNAENSVLHEPLLSIEEFLALSQNIRLKFIENHTVLWHKSLELPKLDNTKFNDDFLSISQGNIESIDEILSEHDYLLTSTEIESYFIDAILYGNSSHNEIINKLLPQNSTAFKDNAQRVSFTNHVEELWEELECKIKPDFEIPEITDIRKNILDNLDDFYSWYKDKHGIITNKTDSINNLYAELSKNIDNIRYLLSNLNNKQDSITEDDIEKLNEISATYINRLNESAERISEVGVVEANMPCSAK